MRVTGNHSFFFLFRVRNTFIEGRKQVSSSYEREVQDYTGGIGTQAASVGLFEHCLFPLPSQFWAEEELRHERGRGRKNTETLRDSFQAGVSWTWAFARGWRGDGMTPWWADWLLKQPILWSHRKVGPPFLSSIISPPCSILRLSGRKANLGP